MIKDTYMYMYTARRVSIWFLHHIIIYLHSFPFFLPPFLPPSSFCSPFSSLLKFSIDQNIWSLYRRQMDVPWQGLFDGGGCTSEEYIPTWDGPGAESAKNRQKMRAAISQHVWERQYYTWSIPDMGSLITEDSCLLSACLLSFSECLETESTSVIGPQYLTKGNFEKGANKWRSIYVCTKEWGTVTYNWKISLG